MPKHTALGYVHGFLPSEAQPAAKARRRPKSGQKLSCHKFNVTCARAARERERERESYEERQKQLSKRLPPVDITKKSTYRDVQKLEVMAAARRQVSIHPSIHPSILRHINVSNSSAFHIPPLNCFLSVFLMSAHQFNLVKDCESHYVPKDFTTGMCPSPDKFSTVPLHDKKLT